MRVGNVKVRQSRSYEAVKIQRSRMMHPSGKPITVGPVFANVGVQAWYDRELLQLITEMYFDARAKVLTAAEDTPPVIATDVRTVAAGIMFICGDRLLLVHRSDGLGWAFPGGGIEEGETPEEAARRETFEECGVRYTRPLNFSHVQEFAGIGFATFVGWCEEPFEPTLNDEHDGYQWVTREEARAMHLHPGVFSTLFAGGVSATASDAGPTKALQKALERWGSQWIKRFDLMAHKIADDFAARNQRATEAAMQGAFKRAGFTVAFKPTKASIEAYRVVAAEQVGLIKSIAQKFHTDVEAQVWESVKRGADMRTLSKKLEKTYGITRKRASLIARDQNNKAKATIEAVRHQQLGIKQAIWMHSHAGKEPRPTHVRMNGRLYDLETGMYDSDEGRYVHPGELINCRCTMRPYIPGFG